MNVLTNNARTWVIDASDREVAVFHKKGFEVYVAQPDGKLKKVAFVIFTSAGKTQWTLFKKTVKEHHGVAVADNFAPGFLTGSTNPDW